MNKTGMAWNTTKQREEMASEAIHYWFYHLPIGGYEEFEPACCGKWILSGNITNEIADVTCEKCIAKYPELDDSWECLKK